MAKKELNYSQIIRFHYAEIMALKNQGYSYSGVISQLKKKYGFEIGEVHLRSMINKLKKANYSIISNTQQIPVIDLPKNDLPQEKQEEIKPAELQKTSKYSKTEIDGIKVQLKSSPYKYSTVEFDDSIITKILDMAFNDRSIWIEKELKPVVIKNNRTERKAVLTLNDLL